MSFSRKSKITFLATIIFTGLAVPVAVLGQDYGPLLGTWDVKMEDGSREFVFEFSLKEGQLVGKYTGASGTTDMARITFKENTVKFSVTVGNGMVIDFSAIVAEGELTGTLSLEFGEAPITGKKRK